MQVHTRNYSWLLVWNYCASQRQCRNFGEVLREKNSIKPQFHRQKKILFLNKAKLIFFLPGAKLEEFVKVPRIVSVNTTLSAAIPIIFVQAPVTPCLLYKNISTCYDWLLTLFSSSTEIDDMIRKSTNLLLTRTLSNSLQNVIKRKNIGLTEVKMLLMHMTKPIVLNSEPYVWNKSNYWTIIFYMI